MDSLSTIKVSMLDPPWTHAVCVLAAAVYVDIEVQQQNGIDVGFSTLSKFLHAVLPGSLNWTSSGDMCDWWARSWNTDMNDTIDFVTSINEKCRDEVCDAVGWSGDPDIAGIGMVIVYLTLLSLVLLYTIAEYLCRYTKLLRTSRQDSAVMVKLKKTFMNPFEGTLQDLVDLSLCFSITAEISTLAFHSRAVTRYEMVVAELLCVFASSACAVLWIFHAESGRFRITRFILFVASAALPVAVAVKHGTMRESTMKDFVMMCVDEKLEYVTTSRLRDGLLFTAWGLTITLQISFGIIVLPLAVHNYVLAFRPDNSINACEPSETPNPIGKSRKFFQKCQRRQQSKWFKCVCATGSAFGCTAMIACIIEILRLRNRMREAAGSDYNENEWGFGQIYALTTWFPLAPAFFAIIIKGSQNGFDSRLPEAWKAVKKSMARCSCAAGNCQCRKHLVQSQRKSAEESKLSQATVDTNIHGEDTFKLEQKVVVEHNECCHLGALDTF